MKHIQLVMMNSAGGEIGRSTNLTSDADIAHGVRRIDDKAIVDVIRQWSRIGFAVGDTFAIVEVA